MEVIIMNFKLFTKYSNIEMLAFFVVVVVVN